ncbi:phage tail tape measure protein [Sphingomonas arantia]|uniref:Phage tail tape measure protein n=1 Tax=Sphingomonas arantia TaxID=1460676 RepID=A0ABW4TY88_9SPHN
MSDIVIGSLRGVVGLDTVQFDTGVTHARGGLGMLQTAFEQVGRTMERVTQRMRNAAVGVTVGVTIPMGLVAKSAVQAGGEFEAAMNKVRAAMQDARPEQLKALSDQARQMGPAVGKSAVEAAEGIAALGTAGMNTRDIIGGGFASSLKLAAANSGEVADAGALANDIMVQFNKSASELPQVVDRITGALDASKYGFEDYRLAAAQASGATGGLELTFDDFNIAIAALSTQFSSGASAGTGYASMIRGIVAPTKESEKAMEQLGKRIGLTGNIFLNADGSIKSVADQADILQRSLAGVATGDRGKALTAMFGADGMDAAIALMRQGRQGIEDLRKTIGKASADKKLSIMQEGDVAASQRMAAAFDNLKMTLADSGLLGVMTGIKNAIAAVAESFAHMPPIMAKVIVISGAIAAAMGPVALAMLAVGKIALVLMASRLNPLAIAFTALVNPMGLVVSTLLRMGAAAAAARGMTLLSAALGRLALLAGPIAAVAVAVGVVVYALTRKAEASAAATKSSDALTKATEDYAEAARLAANATGKERDEALKNAAAKREQARQTLATARAQLVQAQATVTQMEAEARRAYQLNSGPADYDGGMGVTVASSAAENTRKQALANAGALKDAIATNIKAIGDADKIIAAGSVDLSGTDRLDFGDADKKRTRKGTSAEDIAAKREELRLEAEIEAARTRGDEATARRLQDRRDLVMQMQAYRDTEMSSANAAAAAARDMALVHQARAEATAKELADGRAAVEIERAQLTANHALEESLRDQEDLRERTEAYYARTANYAEAAAAAEEDMTRLQEARAVVRARLLEQDQRSRQIDLAKLRGSSDETIKALERADEVQRRARQIEDDQGLNRGEGLAQATAEDLETERARITGTFRSAMSDGVRAALDGNLKSFAQDWFKNRMAKGMEDALNSLSKLIERLFANVKIGSGGGGGLGGILGSIGKLFGAGAAAVGGGGVSSAISAATSIGNANVIALPSLNVPKFASGGSFRVGGQSGIDKNLVSMRLSKGEMVDIRKPGQDMGGTSSTQMHFDLRGAVMTQDLLNQMNAMSDQAAIRGAAGGARMAQTNIARASRRRIGG